MFQRRETFLKLSDLPFEKLLAELKKPEIKAAILADKDIAPTEVGAHGKYLRIDANDSADDVPD